MKTSTERFVRDLQRVERQHKRNVRRVKQRLVMDLGYWLLREPDADYTEILGW